MVLVGGAWGCKLSWFEVYGAVYGPGLRCMGLSMVLV